jgi:hypothetical protein
MKSLLRVLGIIAIVAVIGFSFAACGGDDDNGNGGGKKPEDKPVAERWESWTYESSTATIEYTVAADGLVTVNMGGIPAPNWQTSMNYSYSGKANTSYKYTFEAWTSSGDRQLYIIYHHNEPQDVILDQIINIDSTRQTYTINGQPLSIDGNLYNNGTSNPGSLTFCCAGWPGTFYLKVISIEKVSSSSGNPVNPGGGGKDALDKTTWKGNITGSPVNYTITFNSPNFTMSGTDGFSVTGTYTISGSTVTLTAISGGTGSQTATLSGNTLNFSDGGPSLIKQ